MKRIIVAILGLTFLIAGVSTSFSQGRGHGGKGSGYNSGDYKKRGDRDGKRFHYREEMKEKLQLTDKQEKQIFDIKTKYRKLIFENRKNREKVRELHKEERDTIHNVFTDNQKKIIEEQRDQRKNRHRGRRR